MLGFSFFKPFYSNSNSRHGISKLSKRLRVVREEIIDVFSQKTAVRRVEKIINLYSHSIS